MRNKNVAPHAQARLIANHPLLLDRSGPSVLLSDMGGEGVVAPPGPDSGEVRGAKRGRAQTNRYDPSKPNRDGSEAERDDEICVASPNHLTGGWSVDSLVGLLDSDTRWREMLSASPKLEFICCALLPALMGLAGLSDTSSTAHRSCATRSVPGGASTGRAVVIFADHLAVLNLVEAYLR